MDPRQQVQDYLTQHKIPELFEAVTAQLLFYKPTDPKEYSCQYLAQVKEFGTPPLLTAVDFETMFGMFDITNRGVITAEQATSALKNLLGKGASLCLPEGKQFLLKEEFVTAMDAAMKDSAPYKNVR
jgi:hypothetical protein